MLPSSVSLSALDSQFTTVSEKSSQLRLSLSQTQPVLFILPTIRLLIQQHPRDFNVFSPAILDEVLERIHDCPNSLDALLTSFLKHCCCYLAPIITRVTICPSTGEW